MSLSSTVLPEDVNNHPRTPQLMHTVSQKTA